MGGPSVTLDVFEVEPVMTTLSEADALDGLRDALGMLKDREQVARRLLESSAKHSFDPDRELDWEAPFEEGSGSGRRSWCRCTAPRCGGG
ncbi:hypothetical protein SHKM778_16440 [Streptomyces sp. KM77-8]|uniref:Uncharacterized protein n=1 Tax=Streptomyces haneummycinicus TaxID=3074435 RepID=A0AAT9HCY7_9ACTN